MTENQETNQPQVENKVSDKELNFRKVEAKQKETEQQLYQERQARMELERRLQELQSKPPTLDDDEDNDNEPYVDKKKLNRKFSSFEKKLEEKFDRKVEEKARTLIKEKEDEDWLNRHSDFSEVMTENNLTKLVNRSPAFADSIKRIPDGPEKQKLVYNAIKAMELDKSEQKQSSIQDKIDANRRSPYYIPGGPANPPYNMTGDFSPTGQKNAYEKMKQMQKNVRM